MIYFVGAGSGAPDLITVRGARLLSEADVIVYAGSLVNPALLDYKKDGCEVYNSAKMTLEEVIAVMAPAAKAGKTVVRLHTGDPCVYGAHREQMDELDRLGLAYEVCPGVSSFCGAAAALKAEYTLPNVSQSVILTRMEGRTPVPEKEQIESFAAHGATMVIFLSAGQLARLSERLIAGGYAPDTRVQGHLAGRKGRADNGRRPRRSRCARGHHQDRAHHGRRVSRHRVRALQAVRPDLYDRIS